MASHETDGDLAARLAQEAGQLLLDLRAQGEFEGRALGEEGDRRANALLMAALKEARPHDGILSEETRDTPERLEKSRVWIVDPVDGTREYGEGRPDWAVHVGLAVDGAAHLGAVALPGMAGQRVLRSDQPIACDPTTCRPRMVVSRSRPPAEAEKAAAAVDAEIVPMGSARPKAVAVVRRVLVLEGALGSFVCRLRVVVWGVKRMGPLVTVVGNRFDDFSLANKRRRARPECFQYGLVVGL